MNWQEEFWIKLYRRSSPSFMSMRWQARAVFRLVVTELDPSTGRLELGRLGLKAVAVSIQAPWSEVEPYLTECLEDGCLSVDGEFLSCPNYLEAQQAVQTGAARMRKLREARKVARDESSPKSDAASPNRDETYRQRDAVTHTVTRGDECDDQRREEKRREEQSSDIPATAPRTAALTPPESGKGRKTRTRSIPTPLDPDWHPNEAHLAIAKELGRNGAWLAMQATKMRDWAAAKGAKANCADWDARFRNWIRDEKAQAGPFPCAVPSDDDTGRAAADRRAAATTQHLAKRDAGGLSPAEQAANAAAIKGMLAGFGRMP
jgi:hypothetical protein